MRCVKFLNILLSYLKNVELSGTLDKYSDVRPLLNLFELGTNVKFEIEDNVVIVRKAK